MKGEFYSNDFFYNAPAQWSEVFHWEIATGALAYNPSNNEMVTTVYDPTSDSPGTPYGADALFRTQGVHWYNASNGAKNRAYEIVPSSNDPATFGKANGLGDLELLCNAAPIEIGNRVWTDTDKDGIQDANENGIGNVTVELYADFDNNGVADGAALATTTTATSGTVGTWYFNSLNVTDGDPNTSGNQAGPQSNKRYLIRIGSADWTGGVGTGDLANLVLSQSNNDLTTNGDLRDNDASMVSNIPQISVLISGEGACNHSLDFGFMTCPTITNPSATQTLCAGVTGSNITVNTSYNNASGIRFVKFTTDQSATNGSETTTELTNIYAGTAIATVTPTGASNPYTATYTFNAADFPNATSSNITYYVYAILNPDLGTTCRPVQEIRITIKPTPSVNDPSDQVVCNNTTTTAVTFAGSAVSGTTYAWTNTTTNIGLAASGTGNIAAFTATNATSSPVVATITVTPTANSCAGTPQTFTITVNPSVTAGTGTNPTTATCQAGSGLSNINLAGQITGATSGGTWSQTVGTAVGTALNTTTGVFNPNGIAVGTYTFRYTVIGTSPCPNDTEDITITINNCCPPSICVPVAVTRN